METVLLSPDTTASARKPASQQGIMGTQSDDNQDFSPLMDEAVENIENGQSPQDPETQQNTDHPENSFLDSLQDDNDIDRSPQSMLFAETANTTINLNTAGIDRVPVANSPLEKPSIAQKPVANSPLEKASIAQKPVANSPLEKASIANSTIVIPTDDATTLQMEAEGTSTNQLKELAPQIQAKMAVTSKNTEAPALAPGITNSTVPTSKVESFLLQQIHQILDQGKENGTLIVRGNELASGKLPSQINDLHNLSNPILSDTNAENGTIQPSQTGISLPIIEDSSRNTPKSAKLAGVHQDVSEQFLNAKLGQSKRNTNDGSEQRNSEQKGFNQTHKEESQQAATSLGNTVTNTKVVESSFGQLFGQVSSTTPQTTSIEGKFAPGAHPLIPQKELVDNLIKRFNINPRLQTSKISMQLHPVELGALKIDILVKNDSLSANIVAQSRQVMETLEKNMPRLRAVLEDQGFTIDAFEITMENGGENQKELSQEQFSSQQQEFTRNESSSKNNESFDAVLNSQEESGKTDEETSGVNLRV
ncbi:MAG: flagellar hook-length control protein FliK [Desulfocapsa sp.]|nr:flagellar hook-length control protein FliK [Desulfocapsa sp.]